jgi:sec-independent protein translocase protein TatA
MPWAVQTRNSLSEEGRVGLGEVLLILLIILLLVGASLIPRLARSLGTSKREFKKGLAEAKADEEGEHADERAQHESKDSS